MEVRPPKDVAKDEELSKFVYKNTHLKKFNLRDSSFKLKSPLYKPATGEDRTSVMRVQYSTQERLTLLGINGQDLTNGRKFIGEARLFNSSILDLEFKCEGYWDDNNPDPEHAHVILIKVVAGEPLDGEYLHLLNMLNVEAIIFVQNDMSSWNVYCSNLDNPKRFHLKTTAMDISQYMEENR